MRRHAVLLAAALAVGADAWAYEQAVHELLSRRAYAGAAHVDTHAEGDAAAVRLLRARLWEAGAHADDAALRQRFVRRYPSLDRFDAWELKRLLGLNPERTVAGLDEAPLPPGTDGAAVFALASRLPDDDLRNQARFAHDAARKVLYDGYGQPLPDDPATLEMGSLTGLSSQAHAHYQLPPLDFSDDPAVLKSDPRRFAIPPTVHTFGAAFADEYTALAVMAAQLPDGGRLALTLAGAAAHHVEDIANQIHAVQVGVYGFFVDAKVQSIVEDLKSIGGLARPRPGFVDIGIQIIANHHTLLEALFAKHLLATRDPVGRQGAAAPADATFAAALDAVPTGCAPGFARTIALALADRSSREGPEVYSAIRSVADPRLSRAGQTWDERSDPDAAVRSGADLGRFYALEVAGARRSDQALAAWWAHFATCTAADATAWTRALLVARLDELDAAEQRASKYLPKPPQHEQPIALWVPATYAGLLALVAVVIIWRRRRRRT